MKYRSIFVSDVHLGTKSCKASALNKFLKANSCLTLYLVGDIIDGWKIKKNAWRWSKKQTSVVRTILKLSSSGVNVIYIPGNHDEFIRPMLHQLSFNGLMLTPQHVHVGVDGKRYLVTHGDLFDGISKLSPALVLLGDTLYDLLLGLNNVYSTIRHRFGFGYWSLSKYLKHKVKHALNFIFQFEKNLAEHCKRKGYDGVICGHIHHPEIKEINGVAYMNDGDWVESCSALVEHHDGRFELVFTAMKADQVAGPDGSALSDGLGAWLINERN